MKILCIGNGESRKDLNLDEIDFDLSLGSNAIHRDYLTDLLVCCDKRMVQEALDNSYPNTILTRPEWANSYGTKQVASFYEFFWNQSEKHKQSFHWGSGLHSVYHACNMLVRSYEKEQIVQLVGFDLYGLAGKVNNLYKGSTNYSQATESEVDSSFWIKQFAILFSFFEQIQFSFYHPIGELPIEWAQYKNIDIVV